MPDWYPAYRAARLAGQAWPDCDGVPWGPIPRAWVLIAEAAEAGARELFRRDAEREAEARARRGR
jgi:hypothetical protein